MFDEICSDLNLNESEQWVLHEIMFNPYEDDEEDDDESVEDYVERLIKNLEGEI